MCRSTDSIRIDEATARRLRSLSRLLDIPVHRLIRELAIFIDDRDAPVGRLSGFRAWRDRLARAGGPCGGLGARPPVSEA